MGSSQRERFFRLSWGSKHLVRKEAVELFSWKVDVQTSFLFFILCLSSDSACVFFVG
jgi:hypothetical protein